MDTIINEKYLIDAKAFIQTHIEDGWLSDEIKKQFVEYYELLTIDNAKSTYDEIHKLFGNAVTTNHRQFNNSMFKISGGVLLIGAILSFFGYIGEKYTSQNTRWRKVCEFFLYKIGLGTLCIGGIMLLSIGH